MGEGEEEHRDASVNERTDYDHVRSIPGTALFVVFALGHLALALYYFFLLGIKLLETGTGRPEVWRDHGSLFCIQAGLLEFLLGTLTLMGVLPSVRPGGYRVLGVLRLITALHLVPLVPMALAALILLVLILLAWPLVFVEGEEGGMATFFRPITVYRGSGKNAEKGTSKRRTSGPALKPGLASEPVSSPSPTKIIITEERTSNDGNDGKASAGGGEHTVPPSPLLNAHQYAPTPFIPLLGQANGTSMMRGHGAANSKE